MISQIFHVNDCKTFSTLGLKVRMFSSPHFKRLRTMFKLQLNTLYSTLN